MSSTVWAGPIIRLGRYDDAVRELEKAIDLKPSDPVINDHLGDAYWRVGRKLEAHFQWNHARDLNPDPDDLPKIFLIRSRTAWRRSLRSPATTARRAARPRRLSPLSFNSSDWLALMRRVRRAVPPAAAQRHEQRRRVGEPRGLRLHE